MTLRYPKALILYGERRLEVVVGQQDIWPGTAVEYPFLTTPQMLEVVSDDVANGPAGAGGRAVRLLVADENFNFSIVTVPTNGLTPVPVPGGPYLRCLISSIDEAGNYNGAAVTGAIRIRTVSGGEDLQVILPGRNSGGSGIWTFTPKQYPWGIERWEGSLTQINPASDAQFVLYVRNVTIDSSWVQIDLSPELDDNERNYRSLSAPITTHNPSHVHDLRMSFITTKMQTFVHTKMKIVRNEFGISTTQELY